MGFPKTYQRGDLTRVVNTPADEVDAKFNGFKVVHDVDIEPESDSFVVDPVVETPGPADDVEPDPEGDAQ